MQTAQAARRKILPIPPFFLRSFPVPQNCRLIFVVLHILRYKIFFYLRRTTVFASFLLRRASFYMNISSCYTKATFQRRRRSL